MIGGSGESAVSAATRAQGPAMWTPVARCVMGMESGNAARQLAPAMPEIALGAIYGPPVTIECEQTQRNDQHHAEVHPAGRDKRSHEREQIVHFTSLPIAVVVRLDRGPKTSWLRAARFGARRSHARANSVPLSACGRGRDGSRRTREAVQSVNEVAAQ